MATSDTYTLRGGTNSLDQGTMVQSASKNGSLCFFILKQLHSGAGRTMIFQGDEFVIDDIGNQTLVFVNSKKNPTNEEYEHVLKTYRRLATELPKYRCLAITDGAGPTLQQRQQQAKEFGNVLKSIPTAIVSDAITVRFVVSSAAIFIKSIRAFDVNEFHKALAFLGFAEDQHGAVSERLSALPRGKFKALDAALNR